MHGPIEVSLGSFGQRVKLIKSTSSDPCTPFTACTSEVLSLEEEEHFTIITG